MSTPDPQSTEVVNPQVVMMQVELPPQETRRIYQVVSAATRDGVVTGILTVAAILVGVGAVVYFTGGISKHPPLKL